MGNVMAERNTLQATRSLLFINRMEQRGTDVILTYHLMKQLNDVTVMPKILTMVQTDNAPPTLRSPTATLLRLALPLTLQTS